MRKVAAYRNTGVFRPESARRLLPVDAAAPQRFSPALVGVVQQAYVCGVSTRRVDQLVESLGLRISKSEVSRIAGLLDEQVSAFLGRPLEGR
jgi:transposase-like protein